MSAHYNQIRLFEGGQPPDAIRGKRLDYTNVD